MRINHIAMYVNDLEAARDFFVRYFEAKASDKYHNPRTGFQSFFMTFDDGSQEVSLEKNYRTTITVNVQEDNPDAEGVGSDWESWSDF